MFEYVHPFTAIYMRHLADVIYAYKLTFLRDREAGYREDLDLFLLLFHVWSVAARPACLTAGRGGARLSVSILCHSRSPTRQQPTVGFASFKQHDFRFQSRFLLFDLSFSVIRIFHIEYLPLRIHPRPTQWPNLHPHKIQNGLPS